MATGRQQDVSLVIKARDEAQGAIKAITAALKGLDAAQHDAASGSKELSTRLGSIIGTAASLDKAYSQVAGAVDNGAAAVERQAKSLAANQAQLAALKRQLDAAKTAAAGFAAFIGPQQPAATARYAAIGAEVKNLETQIRSLNKTVGTQESGFSRSVSDLQEIARAAKLVGAAETFAKQQTDELTASLQKQVAQSERAARAMQAINSSVFKDSGKSAEVSASVFQKAGLTATEKQIAAEAELTAATARTNAQLIERARLENALAKLDSRQGLSAKDSAAVFQTAGLTEYEKKLDAIEATAKQAAVAEEEMAAAAARLRGELNPLGVIQDRLNRELTEANALYKAGKISATELAQAELLLKNNADQAARALGQQSVGGGKPTLFGLKPYEVQNLGYQINDVVTQLASGTSFTQTMAQQGGQLLQIFPRVGSSLVAAFTHPGVLAFAASIGTVIIALNEAGNKADRLRGFLAQLSGIADGKRYGAAELNEAAESLDRYGLSAKDAVAAVRLFVNEGINPARIEEFGRTAADLAEVMGIELKDAAAKVADAFTRGYDSVAKLDDQYQFLTAAQRENIRTMFEEGRATEARNEAMRLFSENMKQTAENARGPWAGSIRELGSAWQEFKSYLADLAPIREVAEGLEDLGKTAARVIRQLRGATTLADTAAEIYRIHGEIASLNVFKAKGGDPLGIIQKRIDSYVEDLKRLYAEQKRLQGEVSGTGSSGDTRLRDSEQQKKIDAALALADKERLAAAKKLSDQARIELAYKKALLDAEEKGASAAAARASAEQAASLERGRVAEENAREAERAARAEKEGMTALNQTIALLKSVEGFRSKAYWDKNAFRVGFGSDTVTRADGRVERVTAGTSGITEADALRDLTRRIEEFTNVVKGQIGSERFNQFSASQQAALTSIAYNYGTLPKRILDAVRRGTNEEIAAAVRGLKGDNGGINAGRREREAQMLEMPNLAVDNGAARIIEDAAEAQAKFNSEIDAENEKRRQSAELLRQQTGLQGEALIAEQRKQAIAEALLAKQQELDRLNIERRAKGLEELKLTEAQRAEIEKTTGAYFDLSHAKDVASAQRQAVDKPVADLTALRDQIQQQIQFYQETGKSGMADQLQPQLDGVNAKLREATTNALAFYQALGNDPARLAGLGLTKTELDAIVQKLQFAAQTSQQWGYILGISGQQIAQTFASTAVSAIDSFAQAIASGEKATDALKNAFLSFASNFLRQIAQMILQQVIFNAVSGLLKGFTGGIGGGGGAVAGVLHTGGIAGSGGGRRSVSPAWFGAAARYHTGGIAGLRPDEVPAVLQRGEEVLTTSDPRHRANGGGGAGGNVKVVNLFDPAEAMSMALQTRVGEKVLLNFVKENAGAVKAALG